MAAPAAGPADRHRVLALDLRGFGWSDAPRAGYEKENLADDVLRSRRAGIQRVKLLAGYEQHADEMEVEFVSDSGHFIADKQPERVAVRARDLFASA